MTGNRGSCHLQIVGGALHLPQYGGRCATRRSPLGTRGGSRSRRGQRPGVIQRASGFARAAASDGSVDTRPVPPLLRQILHRQVLHRDIATPEPVEHDLHLGLKAIELYALAVEDVGDPGTAEESEEAKEHV